MRWRGRRQSSNIEDRRGAGGYASRGGPGRIRIPMGSGGGGVRRASGGGLGLIVILVIGYVLLKSMGIDPSVMLDDGSGSMTPGYETGGGQITQQRQDEMKQFVATVLAETEDVWHGIFQSRGASYEEPVLVLFTGRVNSACGLASAASGPFYCPSDHKLYIDLSFYNQLAQQFGAAGDFAQAYVIAHEVGHHVQNLIGVLPQFNQMRSSMSEVDANRMSVRVELQADCFAGIWGHFTDQKGLLERGDLEEALNAAHQIGDDTLQRRTQGYVVPDSFNHGTSEQRAKWFKRGFDSGRLDQCDTFNEPV